MLGFWILWISNGEEKRVYSALSTMDVFPQICIFFSIFFRIVCLLGFCRCGGGGFWDEIFLLFLIRTQNP